MNLFSSNQKPTIDTDETIKLKTMPEEDLTPQKTENPFIEIIRFSVIALLIVIPIRMFVAQPFIVSGASMEQTFHTGEYLIVDQVSYQINEPVRGDVIIFRYPKDPSKYFIKRVIGLPGDTVVIEGSKVTIKDETHPEGFILKEPYIKSMSPDNLLTEKLGPREYFVMGDNRDQSSDSRSWGVLQEERIIGKAFLRLYPPSTLGMLPGDYKQTVTSDSK